MGGRMVRGMTGFAGAWLLLSAGTVWPEVSSRIVNGLPTQDRATVGALLVDFKPGLFGICSGTLIGCGTFLTAAHCVCSGLDSSTCGTPDPSDFKVYLQHGGIFDVGSVVVNPAFDFGTASDVAVLTLSNPVTGIVPTPINTSGTPPLGTFGDIAGFGITSGVNDDLGLKREGSVVSASCFDLVPEPAHICWAFADPVGAPGTDSNTCNGDSGGPLFMNIGGSDAVAGVTSGGFNSNCQPPDLAFDANVFENRTFIQNAAADLSPIACGPLSEVGAPETEVITFAPVSFEDSAPPDQETRTCRAEIRRQYQGYSKNRLSALQSCVNGVNAGKSEGACPDARARNKIDKAAAKVRGGKLVNACGGVIQKARLAGECAGVTDIDSLQACILAAGDNAVAAMLGVEYADDAPAGPILDKNERQCQTTVAKAAKTYALGQMSALNRCLNRQDGEKVEICPDAPAQAEIVKLAGGLQSRIEKICSSDEISALDTANPFGGGCAGATDPGALAICQRSEHDAAVGSLVQLVKDLQSANTVSFTVTPETARFRVTLNAIDKFPPEFNDLDILVKRGSAPTPTDFDFISQNFGVYEAVEVDSPGTDQYFVRVFKTFGEFVPYQLTITKFRMK